MKSTKTKGIAFTEGLALLFIALKLTHVIDWPWLWVLSPIWIPLAILLAGFIIFGMCYVCRFLYKRRNCIFKGHDYVGKYERIHQSYGFTDTYVTRCTKCGKIQKENKK